MHPIEEALAGDYKAHQFVRIPNTTVTICAITLTNGFVLVGKSACVNPDNFNAELGEKYAAEDALLQFGPFFGWRECDRRTAIYRD